MVDDYLSKDVCCVWLRRTITRDEEGESVVTGIECGMQLRSGFINKLVSFWTLRS
jgi:hypothetical protein